MTPLRTLSDPIHLTVEGDGLLSHSMWIANVAKNLGFRTDRLDKKRNITELEGPERNVPHKKLPLHFACLELCLCYRLCVSSLFFFPATSCCSFSFTHCRHSRSLLAGLSTQLPARRSNGNFSPAFNLIDGALTQGHLEKKWKL